MQRMVTKKITAQATQDGDGVKIARSIGSSVLPDVNPFLLLDELRSNDAADYIGGFPPHPHRGFETVTYMLEGQMRHKDSAGNEGVIRAGDIQWMTAGSGIIHSEMPEQSEGRLWGFQFWINLPATQKMRTPRYQEIAANQIPEHKMANGKIRLLAGQIVDEQGVTIVGAIHDIATQPLLLDVQLNQGEWQTCLPAKHLALVYVYKGVVVIGNAQVQAQQLAVLSDGDQLTLNASDQPFGAIILAATPINEPIARSGPFVMNTEEEIQQAFSDYRLGNFAR
jgi:quercetin 2,3-dioxygenase